jgi:transposase
MSKDARSLTPDAQAVVRRRAVKAVEDGMSQLDTAKVFGVTRQAVGRWVKAWRGGGAAALAARKRGPKGERGKLWGWQAGVICNLIRDKHPEQLKLPFALWTSEAVRHLIGRRLGVVVSARSVRRYLAGWGFTPQKPRRVAYERDEAQVKRWMEEEYPAIRRRAKAEKARLYWGDEMGLRSDHQTGRSYAPKGRMPTTPGTGNRFGTNVLSAITNRGHLAFMVFKSRFTTKVFLRFLRRLLKEARRKVFLIVDGHPVHRSRAARNWLAAHAGQIEMFFLPGYSPDLNPDEMLNQDVKSNAVGRRRARNRPQMMRIVRDYLHRRRRNPRLVQRYFHEESVRYAAA